MRGVGADASKLVQKLLRDTNAQPATEFASEPVAAAPTRVDVGAQSNEEPTGVDVFRLIALRNRLADALER